jgi:hypothetical protein
MSPVAAGRSCPLGLISHGDNDAADGTCSRFDEVAIS